MEGIVQMEQVKPVYKEDDVNRYNHPYHELYDGTKIPYGHVCDDGIYRLCFTTTSRYGYMAEAIFVAYHKFNDNGYPNHMYHVFVGECPHKDENGNWVTHNEVPNFLIGAFGGAHYIDAEPDIPHILDIQTDEFWHDWKKRRDNEYDEIHCKLKKTEHELNYCTFKQYLKGLRNRMGKRFGTFAKFKGNKMSYISYTAPNGTRLSYYNSNDKTSKYFWLETEDWWRFLTFKEKGKWCLKYKKEENTHCHCAC